MRVFQVGHTWVEKSSLFACKKMIFGQAARQRIKKRKKMPQLFLKLVRSWSGQYGIQCIAHLFQVVDFYSRLQLIEPINSIGNEYRRYPIFI